MATENKDRRRPHSRPLTNMLTRGERYGYWIVRGRCPDQHRQENGRRRYNSSAWFEVECDCCGRIERLRRADIRMCAGRKDCRHPERNKARAGRKSPHDNRAYRVTDEAFEIEQGQRVRNVQKLLADGYTIEQVAAAFGYNPVAVEVMATMKVG